MITLLKYAASHCLCPGPYNNDCVKCLGHDDIMRNKATEYARAVEESLVYFDAYRHIVLLPRGSTILSYSRGDYAAPTEETEKEK